ncbi:barstar family protein [uncultured Serinicoccus sp.]|uniref:barstar family protein n=1 Tax=uncultured Serinicoccus sp. TaxID=735514 RepID=UPI002632F6A9|nr:barstar family protein [uncultured Serinicoccus sp.]
MIILPAERLGDAEAHFARAGYALAEVTTPGGGGLRETQAQLAEALRLPAPAGRNLDAMADALRDLRDLWDGREVALLWQEAGALAARDGRAWWILAEILDDADALAVVALGASGGQDRG